MADNSQNPNPPQDLPSSSSSSNSRVSGEIGHNRSNGQKHHHHFPNPPDATNPDPATLREQWNFAKKQYSRWYANAWGTAILAGLSFYALGWIIKGSNPLPSLVKPQSNQKNQSNEREDDRERDIPSPPAPPSLTSSPSDAYETPKS